MITSSLNIKNFVFVLVFVCFVVVIFVFFVSHRFLIVVVVAGFVVVVVFPRPCLSLLFPFLWSLLLPLRDCKASNIFNIFNNCTNPVQPLGITDPTTANTSTQTLFGIQKNNTTTKPTKKQTTL